MSTTSLASSAHIHMLLSPRHKSAHLRSKFTIHGLFSILHLPHLFQEFCLVFLHSFWRRPMIWMGASAHTQVGRHSHFLVQQNISASDSSSSGAHGGLNVLLSLLCWRDHAEPRQSQRSHVDIPATPSHLWARLSCSTLRRNFFTHRVMSQLQLVMVNYAHISCQSRHNHHQMQLWCMPIYGKGGEPSALQVDITHMAHSLMRPTVHKQSITAKNFSSTNGVL